MRLIIAGSRGWDPSPQDIDTAVWWLIEGSAEGKGHVGPVSAVVCGMAPGADMAGYRWARERGVPVVEMGAAWERLGKKAGKVRNKEMAEYADAALVFWDGDSNGSTNMYAWMGVLGKPGAILTKERLALVDSYSKWAKQ